MRTLIFDPQVLRKHLLRRKIATLPELKDVLGTTANLTVFRKLKPLDYLTSYTHRGRYYALRESARFDNHGLWSHEAVWFPGTARSSPPSNPLSISHHVAASPTNSLTHSMLRSKIPSTIWSAPDVYAAPRWPAASSILRSICGRHGVRCVLDKPRFPFLC
jgi:hypothetical protein